jgi:hypothetical protein
MHARAADAVAFVTAATTPVYVRHQRGFPEVVGTGVVAKFAGRAFVMSAAHTLDFMERQRTYVAGERIVPVTGQFFRTSRPDYGRDSDRIDLGLIELAPDEASRLGSQFITPSTLLLREIADRRPILRSKYLLLGYPRSRQPTRLVGDEHHAPTMNSITHEVEDLTLYARLGVTFDTHIVVHFDRRDFIDRAGSVVSPHPRGVSGGGIWLLQNFMTDGPVVARLVAIATEFHEKCNAIIGSRVASLLTVIAQRHPDTRADIALAL